MFYKIGNVNGEHEPWKRSRGRSLTIDGKVTASKRREVDWKEKGLKWIEVPESSSNRKKGGGWRRIGSVACCRGFAIGAIGGAWAVMMSRFGRMLSNSHAATTTCQPSLHPTQPSS